MYSKTHNKVTFFENSNLANTEKTLNGNISVGIKNSEGEYEYENWNARFCGKCLEKAKTLKDKDKITLTEWSVRNRYDKEKGKAYTYIMVYDFEPLKNKD